MADGVRRRLGATWAMATTGVAGPDPQDGKRPGTVHVALAGPDCLSVTSMDLRGDRADVRSATVDAALDLLAGALASAVQPKA